MFFILIKILYFIYIPHFMKNDKENNDIYEYNILLCIKATYVCDNWDLLEINKSN